MTLAESRISIASAPPIEAEQAPTPRERAQTLFKRIGTALPSNLTEGKLTDPDGEWYLSRVYDMQSGELDITGLRRLGIDGKTAESYLVAASGDAVYLNSPLRIREEGPIALSKAEARWNSVLWPSEKWINPRKLPLLLMVGIENNNLLTQREIEILSHAGAGQTNKMIAHELSISEQTVKNHMTIILRKTGAQDRTAAVMFALNEGLLSLSTQLGQ